MTIRYAPITQRRSFVFLCQPLRKPMNYYHFMCKFDASLFRGVNWWNDNPSSKAWVRGNPRAAEAEPVFSEASTSANLFARHSYWQVIRDAWSNKAWR